MTDLVFPTSPTIGDVFPVDNPQWMWTGTHWKTLNARPVAIPDPTKLPIGLSPETTGSSYGVRRFIRYATETINSITDDDTWVVARRSDGTVVGVRASSFGSPDFNTGGITGTQTLTNVVGDTHILLSNGWSVRIGSTAGNWTPVLDGYLINRMFRWTLTIDTTNNAHKPAWPVDWKFPNGQPATTLFEAGKRAVISLEWYPHLLLFICHLIDSGNTPGDEVDDTPVVVEPDPGDPSTPTGETVTVQGDTNKVTMSVTPSDGTLSTTWSHPTFTLFQFRYRNFTDNLEYQWDNTTNNTSRVVTGLNNAKLYEVQVRLYNNVVKLWQDWQTIIIAPDGTAQTPPDEEDPEAPPPPPPPPSGSITSKLNFRPSTTAGHAEGRSRWRQRGATYGPRFDIVTNGVPWMPPRQFLRMNATKDSFGAVNLINTAMQNSITWMEGQYARGEVHSDAVEFANQGHWPFVSMTMTLAMNPTTVKDAFPENGNNLKSLLSLAEVAHGDWDERYKELGRRIQNSTIGGYTDWPNRVLLHLAHEHNGPWYKSYSGVDSDLTINKPELKNASYADWGAEIAEGLREAGRSGNRGPVWQMAFHRAAQMIRSTCPEAMIDLTTAAVSAIPDSAAPTVSNLSSQVNVNFMPDPQWVDCYGYDPYWRGGNRFVYIGPNGNQNEVINHVNDTRLQTSRNLQANASDADLLNLNNWISPSRFAGVLEWYKDYAKSKGRPVGLWECGTQYPDPSRPDLLNTVLREICSNDNEARIGWKWMIEKYTPTIDFTRSIFWNAAADMRVGTTMRVDLSDPVLYSKTRTYLSTVFNRP